MKSNNCCEKMQNVFGDKYQKCFSNKTSAKENNRTFVIKNPNKENFCRINVDGCLIDNVKQKKCDFVFLRCKTDEYYFVELKGSDTEQAVKQLENTIDYFKQKNTLSKQQISAFIVSSRVPSNSNQRFNTLKQKFRRDYGIRIKISTKKFEMIIK